MTPPQTCRFGYALVGAAPCEEHTAGGNRRFKADICDLALAALRAAVEEQARVIGRLLPIVQKLSTIHVISSRGQMIQVAGALADEALKALSSEPKEVC